MSSYADGFVIGDLNDDGLVEIACIEPDWPKGATSADGPLVEVLRRWDGVDFAEIGRRG